MSIPELPLGLHGCCAGCRFWKPRDAVAYTSGKAANYRTAPLGECRCHAPTKQDEVGPVWIITSKDDWCGDHSRRSGL